MTNVPQRNIYRLILSIKEQGFRHVWPFVLVMSWDLAHTGVSSKSYISQYSQHEVSLIYEECFSHDWKGSTQND